MRRMLAFILKGAGWVVRRPAATRRCAGGANVRHGADGQNMPEVTACRWYAPCARSGSTTPIIMLTTESSEMKNKRPRGVCTGWMVVLTRTACWKRASSSTDRHPGKRKVMAVDLKQFQAAFFDVASEHLADMERLLLELDPGNPDAECVNAIFRSAHSIKGGANMFGLAEIAGVTHEMETVLDAARRASCASRRHRDICRLFSRGCAPRANWPATPLALPSRPSCARRTDAARLIVRQDAGRAERSPQSGLRCGAANHPRRQEGKLVADLRNWSPTGTAARPGIALLAEGIGDRAAPGTDVR
jgi:HPt (histidine-containing phosphotransfer) domain-containing protein